MDIKLNEFSHLSTPPIAGKIDFNTHANNDFITNEAFKTLRSNILFCGKNIKTILVTSSGENEGKSTIASELAKSLSDIGKKTLLIDADMRKSVILRKNPLASRILGLSEFLSDQAELFEIIYSTHIPNLNIIFSGRFPPNPVELLNSDRFADLLQYTAENYDFIVIDSPPLTPVIDASVISTHCDGALLVVAKNKTKITDAYAVKEQLKKSGCKILGVVLNQPTSKGSDYGLFYKKSKYYYSETHSR